MAKYDNMSFKKAFAAARKEMGAGKTFTWKGNSYTTNLKEEKAKKPAAGFSVEMASKAIDKAAGIKTPGKGDVRPKRRPASTEKPKPVAATEKITTTSVSGKPMVDSTAPKLGPNDTSTRSVVARSATATKAPAADKAKMTAAEKAKADAEARRAKSRAGTTGKKKQVTAVGKPSGGGFLKSLGDILSSGGLSSQHKKKKK